MQTRLAFFYCASALSGAFSGLLAFAIAKMDGVGGRPGWAWIFLLEGLATIVIGCACFIIMPDTPQLSGRWLTEPEIRYLTIQTLIKEGGSSTMEKTDKFRWSQLWELITDYKLYLQAWILFTASACSYGKILSRRIYPTELQELISSGMLQVLNSRCLLLPSPWATLPRMRN